MANRTRFLARQHFIVAVGHLNAASDYIHDMLLIFREQNHPAAEEFEMVLSGIERAKELMYIMGLDYWNIDERSYLSHISRKPIGGEGGGITRLSS